MELIPIFWCIPDVLGAVLELCGVEISIVLCSIVLYWGLKSKGLTLLKCTFEKSLPCVETNYPRTIDARRYSYGFQNSQCKLESSLIQGHFLVQTDWPGYKYNVMHEKLSWAPSLTMASCVSFVVNLACCCRCSFNWPACRKGSKNRSAVRVALSFSASWVAIATTLQNRATQGGHHCDRASVPPNSFAWTSIG